MLHLVDNRELRKNSYTMVKDTPIYDTLNSSLMQHLIFHTFLSVGELMMPYYGHHSCKMFICGKPSTQGTRGMQGMVEGTFRSKKA